MDYQHHMRLPLHFPALHGKLSLSFSSCYWGTATFVSCAATSYQTTLTLSSLVPRYYLPYRGPQPSTKIRGTIQHKMQRHKESFLLFSRKRQSWGKPYAFSALDTVGWPPNQMFWLRRTSARYQVQPPSCPWQGQNTAPATDTTAKNKTPALWTPGLSY